MSRRIVACAEIVGRGGRRVFDVFSCVLVIFDFSLNYFQSFITPLISVLASPLSASFQRCQRVCCLCTFWSTQCLLWCRFWGIYCTSIWRTISVLWAVSWPAQSPFNLQTKRSRTECKYLENFKICPSVIRVFWNMNVRNWSNLLVMEMSRWKALSLRFCKICGKRRWPRLSTNTFWNWRKM